MAALRFALLALCIGLCSQALADDVKVSLTVRAFIPKTHVGSSEWIVIAQNGASLLKDPILERCFGTDQRGFDPSSNASSRVSLTLKLIIRNRRHLILEGAEKTTGSTGVYDCKTGASVAEAKKADPETSISVGEVKRDGLHYVLFFSIGAGNPQIPLAPKIDAVGSIRYSVSDRLLSVIGTTGTFPAFEIFHEINGSKVVDLSRSPVDGASPFALIDFGTGVNTRNYAFEFTIPR